MPDEIMVTDTDVVRGARCVTEWIEAMSFCDAYEVPRVSIDGAKLTLADRLRVALGLLQ